MTTLCVLCEENEGTEALHGVPVCRRCSYEYHSMKRTVEVGFLVNKKRVAEMDAKMDRAMAKLRTTCVLCEQREGASYEESNPVCAPCRRALARLKQAYRVERDESHEVKAAIFHAEQKLHTREGALTTEDALAYVAANWVRERKRGL